MGRMMTVQASFDIYGAVINPQPDMFTFGISQLLNPKFTVITPEPIELTECIHCKKLYPKTNRKRFCSERCRKKYGKIYKEIKRYCAICNKEIPKEVNSSSKYCTEDCRKIAKQIRNKQESALRNEKRRQKRNANPNNKY